MNNRKWTAKNPYQGNHWKVLCVCSVGLLRSPTAAHILAAPPYNFNTRSVGLDEGFALQVVDDVILEWADAVICMDDSQCDRIVRMGFDGDVYNFNIEDIYEYRCPQLVEKIKSRADNLEWYIF